MGCLPYLARAQFAEQALLRRGQARLGAAGAAGLDVDVLDVVAGEKLLAREEEALIARAIRQVEQRLGHRTSPADWKVVTEPAGPFTRQQITYAVTRLLGVEIRVSGSNPHREPELPEEGSYVILALASFGKALEHVRQRFSATEGTDDPEGSVH